MSVSNKDETDEWEVISPSKNVKYSTSTGISANKQTTINMILAITILTCWFITHIYGNFYFRIQGWNAILVPFITAWQTWITAGLFITSHDCMHGSFAPNRPRLNFLIGSICMGLYAGFSFNVMKRHHLHHHQYPVTSRDPDYKESSHFLIWFFKFLTQYFGWFQFLLINILVYGYTLFLLVPPLNFFAFWVVPSLGAAFNMFYFGTYLVHVIDAQRPFVDRHRARSLDYPYLVSLFTNFHFGFHIEHHNAPKIPWWDLPRVRKEYLGLGLKQ